MKDVYERLLAAASLRSADGAIRVVSDYEPLGGIGTPLFPPTVKVKATDAAGYLVEPRYVDGEETKVVLLDQRQSQANRCEAALLDAVRGGEVFIPHLEMATESEGMPVRMTSLDAPHRSRDAYFRDSVDSSGTKFDDTEAGAALRDASARDVSAYLRLVPSDLAYGVWDSHRKRRIQVKIPRTYTSEMVGVAPLVGVRAAGRVDRLNLAGDTVELTESGWAPPAGGKPKKGAKTARMSELGHGMIPPSEGLGGVSVTSVQRSATISLAQLSMLRFGSADEEYAEAARALVASIALLGDRLAFASPALRLRSGCDLLMISERVEWVQRGSNGRPVTEPFELSTPREAVELFRIAVERAHKAGVEWAASPLVVHPNASLQQAIDKSYVIAGIGEAESE
ncbi:type I-U CRISPR-associated protein Cas7 [Streptomyces sp. TRM66268-LWL]|uniref:Type I-U CRISPR-associated protein Cas7 n=1 Tax=Streptomyces polyasparticus TaxID=2767826 RepID=A0ABR7SLY4_9ACTN|nr:type I-U CRISPR-associated RAMP protein Csb1/Cas7u [Streptomyces polyasparticus]MBC9715705.1 type I-U CRISPR-associated protein Cas7 [Streptomyces polyasparticus]